MPVLEVRDLSLAYGRKVILTGISLDLNAGEMVGVIGSNGSGKSTLIRALCGVLKPSSGTIALNGRRAVGVSRRELAAIVAVVPQNAALPDTFTVVEVVLMGRYPHLGLLGNESAGDVAIACDALSRTGLSALADRRVNELSGGEKQRLTIARALAQQPRLMLLDEPTAHLDIQHQLEVMELARKLVRDGMGALVALHDMSLAAQFCDRLVLLDKGSIRAEGTPQLVITPENIEVAYGINAAIYEDPVSGRLLVNPFRKRATARRGLIHIIGGGGRAAQVMQLLHSEGFRITAGVLNEGDSDLAAARSLGIEALAVPAFTAIDDASYDRNLQAVSAAGCTVVADIPFGNGNLPNLRAAETARRLVLIEETSLEQRDFTNGNGAAIYRELRKRAVCCPEKGLLTSVERLLESDGS